MDFGDVIRGMKEDPGRRFARKGWTDKGLRYIMLTPGRTVCETEWIGETQVDHSIRQLPHIDMKTVDGSWMIGWLASQTDMLAEDWMEV